MADKTIAEQEHGYRCDLLEIKVVKGNELTDLITETFDGGDFAVNEYPDSVGAGNATSKITDTKAVYVHGSVRGWEVGKQVRVSKQIAALGARGDYIDFTSHVTGLGTEAVAHLVRGLFKVQALDYSGVPVAVQHAVFGKYSPFVTPTQPVSRGMIQGIDRQEIELAHNVLIDDPETTLYSQKIRGSATSRFQAKADNTAVANITKFTFRAKPASDGVFVIPRGALIWAGNSMDATKVTTYDMWA